MTDVEKIADIVRAAYPDIRHQQLRVLHRGADDDALWFFTRPGVDDEVQIESHDGMCPFLVEHHGSPERRTANTPEAVARIIVEWLAADPAR
jgi:hypothetical protein